ncbi:phytoene desaturase family protein [Noviherbaspirillum sedimenti]|uniref:NAD(P)/FAD-dependent oxidoreductase n=1 Tax=Noviherbaspirillum sedimenti TaxID=2320865 RepID=A0A3A3G7G4_9BURK|nr:FAD-dependent oxidoreductase [Noviherbaspirillum sedimenti]RJG02679.1 NAD(P)/FAD-dependent oxidoreductase [Noviherbaspirillum sedimenti]
MATANNYDVIIIGAGLGGLISGAILAKMEGKKVLVLEKNPDIGGKIMSYGYLHNPDITEGEYRKSLAACGHSSIVHSEPAFPEIMEKHGLFKNYIVDTGWHQMSLGPRNRFAQIANALGKSIPISPTVGFLYHQDGKFMQLSDIANSWPKESQQERKRVAKYTSLISKEQSHQYDHVDYQAFLESITNDKNVIDYYGLMGCYSGGLNCPTTVSAGEIIRVNNMNNMAGMHFQKGGGGGVVTGGFKMVANIFADVIRESGGEIRTNSRVTEIVVKDRKAVGVRLKEDSGVEQEINAPVIINNIPPRYLGNILPQTYWPMEFKQRIENQFPLAGLLGFIGLKEPIEKGDGRKGDFSIRQLPGTEELDVIGEGSIFSFEQTSEVDPTRAKNGKCLMNTWISLYPKNPFGATEITNDELIQKMIQLIYDFFRKQYPQWDDVYEWGYFTRAKDMYGMSICPGQLGERRLPVKHPTVENLYHTGDTVAQWGIASDGVGYGALLTVGEVTGKDYKSLIAPWGR